MPANLDHIQITLAAHSVLLFALASTHPDQKKLSYVFGQLMSRTIEALQADPRAGGVLATFEEKFREAIATRFD